MRMRLFEASGSDVTDEDVVDEVGGGGEEIVVGGGDDLGEDGADHELAPSHVGSPCMAV